MPIEFSCPYCNASFRFPDEAAGRPALCPGCKRAITTPVGGGPGVFATPVAKSKSSLIVLAVVLPVVVLVLLMCGGVLVGLTLPAVQSARESARRAMCTVNLKQIAMAMAQYEAANGTLPPAYLADKQGKPVHSWRVLILPYLEHDALYKLYDFKEPWDGPHNRRLADAMPPVYACPGVQPLERGITSYAVVVGEKTAFPPGHAVSLNDIPDGTANTLLVVEAEGAKIPWMEPRDLSEADMPMKIVGAGDDRGAEGGAAQPGISSRHLHGANAATCDGAVHFLRSDLESETVRHLIERNDGESADVGGKLREGP